MDKAFILDILCEDSCSSHYIVESAIGLAEKFGINAVAEGVKTLIQADCLGALGVAYLQGGALRKKCPSSVANICNVSRADR